MTYGVELSWQPANLQFNFTVLGCLGRFTDPGAPVALPGYGAGRSRLSCPFCVPGIELCPPGKRFMITMVASFVAMAGQFLMPGLAALCRDWKVLQALIICPFLLMLLYWS